MLIGDRLRELREHKTLSQGDVEKRTGLLRCYISRVENGHTVPVLETLEKFARALETPLYALLYTGENPPDSIAVPNGNKKTQWGSTGKDARYLNKLRGCIARMSAKDRELFLSFTQKLIANKNGRPDVSEVGK